MRPRMDFTDLKTTIGIPVVESLDFSRVEISWFNGLFPLKKKCVTLDPPPQYRTSAQKMRQWRSVGKWDQKPIIESSNTVTDERTRRARKRRADRDEMETAVTGAAAIED